MHGEVGDGDLPHIGAEQRRDLLIDAGDGLGAGGAALGERAEVEREDRRRLRVARKEQPVGGERQRTNRLERRAGAGGGGAARFGGRRNRERQRHRE